MIDEGEFNSIVDVDPSLSVELSMTKPWMLSEVGCYLFLLDTYAVTTQVVVI